MLREGVNGSGQDCPPRVAGYRCATRKEAQASRGRLEDVSGVDVPLAMCIAKISAQSTALNNSRIEVLRSRNEALEGLFEEASKQVKDLSSGGSYEEAVENLILEVSHRSFHT